MPILELFFYGFMLWLGTYLLARNSQKVTVQLTGWGLLVYALALAVQIIFKQSILIILLATALLWIGAALYLLPEDSKIRPILIRIWAAASIPLVTMARQQGLAIATQTGRQHSHATAEAVPQILKADSLDNINPWLIMRSGVLISKLFPGTFKTVISRAGSFCYTARHHGK